ncbi:FBD-associated F-box protein At5g56370-like [Arabidopsis lyrata subsp. lyrata]|uniref:FBD-associated F-box protein At5g56370-like n=1 Tax=Arabidopsis lyrata subsp. lyrata TaxID=81972 RepID=UPI000A29B2CA|nr:FBD-associated F-box protein At5g56370-like [Arabidopsis lyrata subsp. lyrata]|eukprot:XP_020865763.1 FBD-associated F-box protein At5g56370-like [Arabidopsis lyrata subsp. lyrata]
MDRISFLPDDVLLHLLSLLTTKDVLKTSVLSKRWRNLWKLVPKLKYIDCDENADHGRFLLFVDRSLLLNTAPVLESLHFKFRRQCSDVDIGFWVRIAAERGLRDFDFYHPIFNEPSRLPQSLFTCGTLVVLKLTNVSLADVKFPVSFQCLKTLHLGWVIYLDDESPQKLLSSCPILEVLVVNRVIDDNVTTTFSITVPTLQKLFYNGKSGALENESEFVLNAPSLKSLEILDGGYECKIEKMPEIVAANVEVIYWNTDNLLGSLTSLKRLSLCLPMESSFPIGKIFHQLVDLEFCTCELEWDVLMYLLKDSPKLRALKLNERHNNFLGNRRRRWDEPSSVPETLMFGLQTLEWRNYRGWYLEKELATFILKHSCRLKTASFSPVVTTLEKQHRMLTELALLSRGSTTCQLVFD